MSSSESVRVVYDCMIFLQAAARPGRVHGTLRLVHEGRVTLCLSPAVIEEVRDVLIRAEVVAKFSALTPPAADVFINDLLSRATIIDDVPAAFSLPRDPKDEPYINLAIAAGAAFVVTWNERHLTYLMRQDTPEGIDFCRRYPHIKIVDPPAFVREMESRVRAPGTEPP
jgi:putative PIN family toxin of toxin-antitoxin system